MLHVSERPKPSPWPGSGSAQGRLQRGGALLRALVLAAVLVVFGLRVYRLGVQSLWYDEAVSAHVAAQGIPELTRWTAEDIQPPLYYYALAGWTRLTGRNEWSLRWPSVVFGVLVVPALFVLGLRLAGRGAGIVAAWLAALHPLYVYYAQEARMYTLLVLLGVLAGYALLRAAIEADPRRAGGWWAAFVAAAAAMLYTHYFGAFLLLAYGVCFGGWWLARSRAWARLWPALVSALAIALLFAPWLPAMLNRYRVDRSYWAGELKLGEALRHVAVSFTAGAPETMLEIDAVRLLPFFALALVVATVALAVDPRRRRALVLGTVVLVVTLVSVLAVASRTPKFSARYLLLASPAYLLILAGGIGALLHRTGPRGRPLGRATAAILAVLLVGAALAGVRNWFTNPAFTKAQWREVAAAVRAQRGADEPVLLVSGHAWPVWDYYAPDLPAVRLPELDVLDVGATLGFDTGAALEAALTAKPGAWLVEWQDEAVDPVGFVPYFLDRAGVEQPVDGEFWQLATRHWRLRPDATYPVVPAPDHSDGANFAHKVALTGWDDPDAARNRSRSTGGR